MDGDELYYEEQDAIEAFEQKILTERAVEHVLGTEELMDELVLEQFVKKLDDAMFYMFSIAKKHFSPLDFQEWCKEIRQQVFGYSELADGRVRLSQAGIELLKVLRDAPTAMTAIELSATIPETRKTIGPLLKIMKSESLITYPYGPRKGVCITNEGLAYLDRYA